MAAADIGGPLDVLYKETSSVHCDPRVFPMRLLDRVASSQMPLRLAVGCSLAVPFDVTGPSAFAGITDTDNPAMASLFDHVRFRFDDKWAPYYRAAAADTQAQRHVVHATLAAVARDVPLLLAFFLLLSAKDATRHFPISRTAINRKRQAHGHLALLDHIEVRASLETVRDPDSQATEIDSRRSPRLHHVRGHLVRRDDRVFWRTPHLRGSASRGIVRSRTVCLSFARARPARAIGHLLYEL